ncbi:beta-ketoacyl synthase chain length factor [Danxiaibacter flavus]|uniref:Beta-ketoacyl synthase chain length factor n=1 Tax=Danxiaibacter flavus TaxID=3049108 RepID=A0ABV3ZE14_9BACT|nr:beta-ketoacyl synthase chain length factor [Chitinophagaceae bacterium DXS]
MLYIHEASCISPQQTFSTIDLEHVTDPVDNKLHVAEPAYGGIPKNMLRRMGKAVRIGVGASLPLLDKISSLNGFIIGTANGGMEESILFLKQIIAYDEGVLTPGSFVQSTANATAAQLSLLTGNRGYNITHVHRGLAFENAVIDAAMMVNENKGTSYLLGGIDDISNYNYKLDYMDGWYKEEEIDGQSFYSTNSAGSIAGEGAAIFLVNDHAQNALAKVKAIKTLHSADPDLIKRAFEGFIKEQQVDLSSCIFLSGENGDSRLLPFYTSCEEILGTDITIARFKHLCGEYPTASAFALWLSCQLLNRLQMPEHMIKKHGSAKQPSSILIYNNHKNAQHSFMLIES